MESLTSSSSAQQKRMLVTAEGAPLKINLQAVELEGRPKLVRSLKGSGALVVSKATEAAIILVDSATESGKRLIRTWGHDASKVVLEHTWARASINIGRPLLEADNWGGAMTTDDGKAVTIDGVAVDDDEHEDAGTLFTNIPLPTPRVTPVDPASQQSENDIAEHSNTAQPEPTPAASKPDLAGLPTTGSPVVMPNTVDAARSEDTLSAVSPPQSAPSPQAIQPLPYMQPTSSVQPSQYSYAPYASQQPYPPSQSQMMSSQPFSRTDFLSSQTVQAPSLPHTPLRHAQSQMMQVTSNSPSVNGLNVQNPNFATIMTIMEVVRHMDQSSWFGRNQLSVSQPNTTTCSMQQPPATPGPTQDHLGHTATSFQSKKREPDGEISHNSSMTRKSRVKRSPDDMSTPSTSRKRPTVVKPSIPPPKRLRKGKERTISAGSSDHYEEEPMHISDGSYSSYSERPRNIVALKDHGVIFLSAAGQPLRFFVQVELHGRHTVVTNIKKNKGKIVNNIADADYLILSPRSDAFQGLLDEAITLGKSPISATFVADCVEEGALLDETDYVLESVAKAKPLKRGRQSISFAEQETSETLSRRFREVKPISSSVIHEGKKSRGTPVKASTDKTLKVVPSSTPSEFTERECTTTSRSPTPPPAATRRAMKNGKYLFTEVEDEYLLLLAKHHLSRDPTISNTALVGKLHKKMPHHTAASWAGHLDKKMKGAVEDVRKRASIAKRKHETAKQDLSQQSINESALPRCASDATDGDSDMRPSQPSQDDLQRQDFDVITRFFASGGGDDDDDERVWQKLEKHCTCRSASSWPEYYTAHEGRVYARIEELMNERAELVTG